MDVNSGNVFSAVSLSDLMAQSLSSDADPAIRSPYDAIALLSHACMLAVGFRLIGLGEEHKIEVPSQPSSSNPLPQEWNASSNYAFRYAHDQSAMEYLLKVSRLGNKAVVNGLGLGDDKVYTSDLLARDFVSESSLPYTISPGIGENEIALQLRKVFISAGRLTDAGTLIKLQIIQKLAPALRKEGYEDSAHAASHSRSSSQQQQNDPARRPEDPPQHDPLRDDRLPQPARPHPFNDPLALDPPRRPPYPAGDFPPPGFEDEYEINRPFRGGIGPERRPLNIGERDLYPAGLGPNDPFRGGGMAPGLGGMGGGGMHPTFDDPMFGGRGGGGGGMDPQAPPGARWDPVGPRFGPGGGGFGGAGGRPPNPFGGFGDGDFI